MWVTFVGLGEDNISALIKCILCIGKKDIENAKDGATNHHSLCIILQPLLVLQKPLRGTGNSTTSPSSINDSASVATSLLPLPSTSTNSFSPFLNGLPLPHYLFPNYYQTTDTLPLMPWGYTGNYHIYAFSNFFHRNIWWHV